MFTKIKVNDHKIGVTAENFNKIQWIANGKVIFSQDVTAENAGNAITLDLDTIEGSEDFLYVRAELYGDGGMCASQAFVIDDGSEPLEYKEEINAKSVFEDLIYMLKSTRIYVLFQELFNAISK